MLKYLGSKRRLAPVLGEIATATCAATAADLFTGTTRVAQELKRRGLHVTAVDTATYSHVLAECYIAADAATVDVTGLDDALARLAALPGRPGYVTETFCHEARYFQPHNGARIDAVRDAIEEQYAGSALHPVLLTSLLLAADRVDSTTGQQMAYLKQWAPRSFHDLELRRPELVPGGGTAVLGDATVVVDELPAVDLAYLDPPYNQHRYFTNYHVWETLVRWDSPASYGVARKRLDARDEATHSVFNRKREMPAALASLIARVRARVVVVSHNDESWVPPDAVVRMLRDAGHERVEVLGFDTRRYVGAQIGVFNPTGERVGEVGRLRNTEYVFVAGPRELVGSATEAVQRTRTVPERTDLSS